MVRLTSAHRWVASAGTGLLLVMALAHAIYYAPFPFERDLAAPFAGVLRLFAHGSVLAGPALGAIIVAIALDAWLIRLAAPRWVALLGGFVMVALAILIVPLAFVFPVAHLLALGAASGATVAIWWTGDGAQGRRAAETSSSERLADTRSDQPPTSLP